MNNELLVKDLEMKIASFQLEKTDRENRLRYEVKEMAKWIEDMISECQTTAIKNITDKLNDLRNDIIFYTGLISTHEQLLKALK